MQLVLMVWYLICASSVWYFTVILLVQIFFREIIWENSMQAIEQLWRLRMYSQLPLVAIPLKVTGYIRLMYVDSNDFSAQWEISTHGVPLEEVEASIYIWTNQTIKKKKKIKM